MAGERIGDAWEAIWEAGTWAVPGAWAEVGSAPTPDVEDDSRRRIGMLVIRGGVGRRGRG